MCWLTLKPPPMAIMTRSKGVIAHEYFHNWSGNRVTCQDWFQLSLKEGFTVLRDQLFSQDMGSAPVKRIEDVRVLRSVQFPEDSGPLAHPIRPDSYREITNFYTATVYNKGAEVIRMIRTMAGEEKFRAGCDLYFDRHDGEAATCEDFVTAMEDGAGLDLAQFRLWYGQAGTPQVSLRLERDGAEMVLHCTQLVPPTPGQPVKQPMPIPLLVALHDRTSGARGEEHMLVLDRAQASFRLPGVAGNPCSRSIAASLPRSALPAKCRSRICNISPRRMMIPSPGTKRCSSWSAAICWPRFAASWMRMQWRPGARRSALRWRRSSGMLRWMI